MYQTCKKKQDSRINNLYILKLNLGWWQTPKVKGKLKSFIFQDISEGDVWAFLIERSAFSRRCFSRSSKVSSTSLSDSCIKINTSSLKFSKNNFDIMPSSAQKTTKETFTFLESPSSSAGRLSWTSPVTAALLFSFLCFLCFLCFLSFLCFFSFFFFFFFPPPSTSEFWKKQIDVYIMINVNVTSHTP